MVSQARLDEDAAAAAQAAGPHRREFPSLPSLLAQQARFMHWYTLCCVVVVYSCTLTQTLVRAHRAATRRSLYAITASNASDCMRWSRLLELGFMDTQQAEMRLLRQFNPKMPTAGSCAVHILSFSHLGLTLSLSLT